MVPDECDRARRMQFGERCSKASRRRMSPEQQLGVLKFSMAAAPRKFFQDAENSLPSPERGVSDGLLSDGQLQGVFGAVMVAHHKAKNATMQIVGKLAPTRVVVDPRTYTPTNDGDDSAYGAGSARKPQGSLRVDRTSAALRCGEELLAGRVCGLF